MTNISPYTDGSTLSRDPPSYLTKKCVVCSHKLKGGKAVFAREVIETGELIAVWNGQIMVKAELATLPDDIKHHAVQVDEGQYLAGGTPNEPPDFLNHSCEPNAGMSSQISIVALRRVFPGEEVNIDYAMCDGSAYDEFNCICGSPLCRGRVSGDDWQRPELWKRYGNHFMPYLLRRIQNLNVGGNQNRKLALVKQEQGVTTGRNVGAGGVVNAPCAAPALYGVNTRKCKLVSTVEVEGEL